MIGGGCMKAFHEVRNYDSGFMVWHSLYSNINFMAHWHKEIELIYIRKGTLEINITDQNVIANEGDFIFCDSGEIHYSFASDVNNSVDFILFDPSILSLSYSKSLFTSPLVTKKDLKQYGIEQHCRQLINTVIYELNHKDAYYQNVIKSSIQQFWFLLKRHLPRDSRNPVTTNKHLSMLVQFQQLLSYIENHYQEKISLENAANRMHFSISYFSKTFKSLIGIPYVTYVNMIRIEHAINLLQRSVTITDIALSCGFSSIRTFNRVFKQITGYTPSDLLLSHDCDTYSLNYYKRKSSDSTFVENDSIMLTKYIHNKSVPLEINQL
jgi:AraC-like DNA-binding protein